MNGSPLLNEYPCQFSQGSRFDIAFSDLVLAVAFKVAAKVQKESNADLRRALLRAKERIEKEEAANVEAMMKHTRLESELEQAKKQMLAAEDNLKRLSKHLGRWKGQVDNEEKERAKVAAEQRSVGRRSLMRRWALKIQN